MFGSAPFFIPSMCRFVDHSCNFGVLAYMFLFASSFSGIDDLGKALLTQGGIRDFVTRRTSIRIRDGMCNHLFDRRYPSIDRQRERPAAAAHGR
jgi:hypothetical protein